MRHFVQCLRADLLDHEQSAQELNQGMLPYSVFRKMERFKETFQQPHIVSKLIQLPKP